jgi:DNA helicase-2/ATP-dependent DNA helicase PcrA
VLRETYDDREEALYVVDSIAGLVARNKAQPGDFAVMYRTNAQSRLLEEAFLQANLPYKLVGAQRFYGRREIKDIIAYLRLVHNLNDEISLSRVINVPARRIGTKTTIALRTHAQKMGISPGELLFDLGSENSPHRKAFQSRMSESLSKFGALLVSWQSKFRGLSPLDLMDWIIEDTGYREYIDDGTDEGRDRWENVMELRRLAGEFNESSLDAFLERVALVSDQDTVDTDGKVPTLLTLHAAKGLEFPIVFIVGLSDGTLPHVRSFDDPEGLQEERRLFYVGITRAKDQLFLILPLNRSSFGYSEPVDESRFLRDVPDELVMDGARSRRQSRITRSGALRWQSRDKPAFTEIEQRYQAGATVFHPVWGEGLVLNSRIQDDDEIVDVFFAGEGLKRLAASLANLELKP